MLDSHLDGKKSRGDCGDNDTNNDNDYDEGRDEKFYNWGTLLVTLLKIFYEPL